uniref:Uncharacterized protein n=1 Tax=Oryza rufipogon TaxID=4529 RepID=A0A679BD29_ORYRU|nr:hypothetical protein [Oryza rufipogon]
MSEGAAVALSGGSCELWRRRCLRARRWQCGGGVGVRGGAALRGGIGVKRTRAGTRSWRGSALAPVRDGGSPAAVATAPAQGGRACVIGGGGDWRAEGRGGTAGAWRKEAGKPGSGARAPGSGEGRW